MSDVIQAILSRRSVRRFTGEPISEGQLTSLLRAGMAAPSAHNSQPWRMLTISNRERMETLIPLTPWWGTVSYTHLGVAGSPVRSAPPAWASNIS